MAGHGDQSERRQEEAIAALLGSKSIKDAAVVLSVDHGTLLAWMKDPAFTAAYRDARRQLVEGAIARLQNACAKAVETLERSLDAAKDSDANMAAKLILEFAIRGVELTDLAERIEALELSNAKPNGAGQKTGSNGATTNGHGYTDRFGAGSTHRGPTDGETE